MYAACAFSNATATTNNKKTIKTFLYLKYVLDKTCFVFSYLSLISFLLHPPLYIVHF